ncbi:hypothetical protein C8R44DRAFT_753127 [Mycena epipterygia]|nr:hypothetical protein C8R44DRAFT_753127 [Mycena epipterygia]
MPQDVRHRANHGGKTRRSSFDSFLTPMSPYPAKSVVHQLNENSGGRPGCTNSKLKGASTKWLVQDGILLRMYSCSNPLADGVHGGRRAPSASARTGRGTRRGASSKSTVRRSSRSSSISAGVAEDFDAWRSAMGPQLFIRICVHGLYISSIDDDPALTKFVHLAVRERRKRPSNPLKLFEYVDITVYDCAALPLGGDTRTAVELRDQYRELDQQAKGRGKAGVALLVTSVSPPDGTAPRATLLRNMPVILMMEEVTDAEDPPEWKDLMRDILNNGTSIKRVIAERERCREV